MESSNRIATTLAAFLGSFFVLVNAGCGVYGPLKPYVQGQDQVSKTPEQNLPSGEGLTKPPGKSSEK